jgi:hypothetical protein
VFFVCNGVGFLLTCLQLTSSSYYGMRYTTKVSDDTDTHDDFKPTNKIENSGTSLSSIIEQVNFLSIESLHENSMMGLLF